MTKQFGDLKLHFSKNGVAYKWKDGDIRRFSFKLPSFGKSDDGAQNGDNYGGEYQDGYGDDGYNYQGYDAQVSGDYEDRSGEYQGRFDFLYHSEWIMLAALVLLPPLGIWILWKREKYDTTIRSAISAVAIIWFVVLLVWLFSWMFRGVGKDSTANTIQTNLNNQTQTQTQLDTTTIEQEDLTGDLTGLDAIDSEVDTTISNTTPSGGTQTGGTSGGNASGGSTSGGSAQSSDAPSADTTVYTTSVSKYYHKTATCTTLNTTGVPMTLAQAQSNNKTACPTCYPAGTSGGSTASGGTSSSAGKYFATRTGKYYHTNATCSKMKNAAPITKAAAVKAGKKACPVCIGNYYMTTGGKYYHKNATCSGMVKAKLVTAAAAKKAGKKACPVCLKKTSTAKAATNKAITYYSTKGGTYYHTKATCSGMKNATRITLAAAKKANQKPCPVCVSKATTTTKSYYSALGGKYYHVKATCSGMKNATKITLATAKKRGQAACPVCIPSAVKKTTTNTAKTTGTIYYGTANGKYYHKNKTCSGMVGAKKLTLATAKKNNMKACPTCITAAKKAATTQTKNTFVYATKNGKYYHSKKACSGITNAKRITLANAKKNGKKACPVCMKRTYYYATASNKYYHVKGNCSGMKNAAKITLVSAKARGKLACPVCVLKKAKAADLKVGTYVVSGGKYYHKNKTCNGMKKAKKVTLAYAKGSGRTACPRCVTKKVATVKKNSTAAADKKVSCYLLKKGTYYHSTKNCTLIKGKKGIVKTSVYSAKKNDKSACPECVSTKLRTYVYVKPTGLLYHRSPGCSGMKNATKLTLQTAVNRAYKRCTKCNAPAAK